MRKREGREGGNNEERTGNEDLDFSLKDVKAYGYFHFCDVGRVSDLDVGQPCNIYIYICGKWSNPFETLK